MVILKLDFEKAFDKIEHNAIMDILRHKGFETKWLNWMYMIMGFGTSSVLLNGVRGKRFIAKEEYAKGTLYHHSCSSLQQISSNPYSIKKKTLVSSSSP
jgi:glucan phosphoethanolaminetransferase (alkaline phosphatase superfamily)